MASSPFSSASSSSPSEARTTPSTSTISVQQQRQQNNIAFSPGSLTPASGPEYITTNDSSFLCNQISCAMNTAAPGVYITTNGIDGGGCGDKSFSLDAKYLPLNELRTAVLQSAKELGERIDEYKRWLEDKEAAFEAQYMFREVNANVELFNRINSTLGRLRQGLKILNGWYEMMQSLEARVLDDMESYASAKAVLDSLQMASSTSLQITGLPVNPVDVAKSNLTRSKSISRQLTRILAAETRLRSSLTEYESQIGSFNRNVIRHNKRVLDLKELGKIIDSLSNNETPLNRVQTSLATLINDSNVSYKYLTADVNLVGMKVDKKRLPANYKNTDYMSRDQIIKTLTDVRDSKLYTTSSAKTIDPLVSYVRELLESDGDQQIEQLIDEIHGNTYDKVKNDLYSTGTPLFQRITRAKKLIDNLDTADVSTYKASLMNIKKELETLYSEQIIEQSRSAVEPSANNMDES